MFSYRHAYHAGNHADVLKHITLVALLDYLTQKDKALTCIDTHAGTGLYSLRSHEAQTSAEADGGIHALQAWLDQTGAPQPAPAIARYLQVLGSIGQAPLYPGSPFLMQQLLRLDADDTVQDQLQLCELNPKDVRSLEQNFAELQHPRGSVRIQAKDGFEALKALLPPASRRGLIHIDPSYEIKTDYARTAAALEDGLKRFATGCYAIWYPIVGRPEAHELPRRLKRIATAAGKSWLHATLNIGSADTAAAVPLSRTSTGRYVPNAQRARHTGLRASGMFIVNPPFVLAEQLQAALPQLQAALEQGVGAAYVLEAAGG